MLKRWIERIVERKVADDAEKDHVLKKIDLPVLRICVNHAYNVDELKQMIDAKRKKR